MRGVRENASRCRWSGFTLIEVVVALSVISLLVALILPAVQQARAAARLAQCKSHLRQFGIAISCYESLHGIFPPGGGNGFSLHAALLPQFEQVALYHSLDFTESPGAHETAIKTLISTFLCPSDPAGYTVLPRSTNYAGNFGTGVQRYGYNGIFQHLQRHGAVRPSDVTDGLSNTAALSEMLIGNGSGERLRTNWSTGGALLAPDEFDRFVERCRTLTPTPPGNDWDRGNPWIVGDAGRTMYNHVLTPNQNSCINGSRVQEGAYTAGSLHPGGVNVLMGDGRVEFVSEQVDRQIWTARGSRNGHELVE